MRVEDGIEGRVENIKLRSTVIVTNESLAVIMPNSKLVQNRLVNYSYGSKIVRLNIPVGVANESNLEKVSAALLEAAGSVEDLLRVPEPQVHFDGFAESSLSFEIRVWIDEPRNHTQIRSKVNFAIESAFRKYNIETPFPQRDLHLRSGSLRVSQAESGVAKIDVQRPERND